MAEQDTAVVFREIALRLRELDGQSIALGGRHYVVTSYAAVAELIADVWHLTEGDAGDEVVRVWCRCGQWEASGPRSEHARLVEAAQQHHRKAVRAYVRVATAFMRPRRRRLGGRWSSRQLGTGLPVVPADEPA